MLNKEVLERIFEKLLTQAKKSYDKGIKDAVLMHREGRLVYKDYTDENGTLMVDIQILPIDEY